MTEEILYIKDHPIKAKSSFGNWRIPIRKTVTYASGLKRDYDDYIHTWTKRDALNIIKCYRDNGKSNI